MTNRENASGKLTLVRIIGTIHADDESVPGYSRRLHELIFHFRPEIICAELSPEQCDGTSTINSKPEYSSAILPAAAACGARVIPIQPAEEAAAPIIQKRSEAASQIESDPACSAQWKMWETLESNQIRGLLKLAASDSGFGFLQQFDLDTFYFEPLYDTVAGLLPSCNEVWLAWNQYMADRILEAVSAWTPARVIVTAGLAHRHILRRLLSSATHFEMSSL